MLVVDLEGGEGEFHVVAVAHAAHFEELGQEEKGWGGLRSSVLGGISRHGKVIQWHSKVLLYHCITASSRRTDLLHGARHEPPPSDRALEERRL